MTMNDMTMVNRTGLERLPRESAKAHAAFRAYLDLGAERSLAAVAAKLGKSKVLMERWSRRYDWSGRIAAHERHVAEIERQAIERLAIERAVDWHKVEEDQRRSEWRARERAVRLANQIMDRWEEHDGKLGTLEGIARLLELASKLGRLAAGMPSEVKEVNTTITGTIDIEWEAALRKTFGQRTEDGGRKAEVVEAEVVSNQTSVISAEPVKPAEIENGGQR